MVFSKVKDRLWKAFVHNRNRLLYITYQFNSPYLTTKLWILSSKKIVSSAKGIHSGSAIVFSSPGGDLDILEAFKGKPSKLDFYWLDGDLVHHLFKNFFGTTFEDYEYNSRIKNQESAMKKYENYLSSIIDNLKEMCQLKVFVNFNFCASSQRKIMDLSPTKEIKFICIFKECFRTPSLMRMTEIVYRSNIERINPYAIYVHNTEIKQMIVQSRIVSEERIIVTGQARSSYFFSEKLEAQGRVREEVFRITYFAIKPTAGLSYFGPAAEMNKILEFENKNFNFRSISSRVEASLIKLVKSNPKIKLTIKGKLQTDYKIDARESSQIVVKLGPPNMELIETSDLIIGLNSTALVEGILAGKEVISCEFGKNLNNFSVNYTYNFFDVVKVAHNEQQLIQIIDLALNKNRNSLNSRYKKVVIDKYLGNSDGAASNRLYDQINNLV